MELQLSRVDVWAASLRDRAGALAEKLDALAQAGVNLEFVIARRSPEKPGTGVVFVTPIKGAKEVSAAKKAGFEKTKSLHSVRVVCDDVPGLGALLTKELAAAKINLRGLSAAASGGKAVTHIAFKTLADANKGLRCLKKISSSASRCGCQCS